MSFKKKDIQDILEDLGAKDFVQNIQIFGNKVMLDAVSPSPAMHDKKKLELALINAFKDKLPNAELKVRVTNPATKVPKEGEQNNKVNVPPTAIQSKKLEGIKHIIAVASGKGGVGKSTVASNLAVSLKNMGFAVGLLDADIYGPSIPTMFDVVYDKPRTIEVDGKSKIQPIESYGIKILSIGFFADPEQAVVWRGPMASKALGQLIHDANWGELDFLVLDLPPGTGDIHLSLVQQLPITGAVIVSTPQTIALADAKKGVGMFQLDAINVPVLGIIENMAYFTPEELPDNKYYLFGKSGAKDLADKLKVPFLGEVPIIQSIREAGDVGRPAALQSNTVAQEAYQEITKNTITSLTERIENLPPTEATRITTMAGCKK